MPACPNCGEESPPGFKFCPQCGRALDGAQLRPEERKVVSVLFCDLADFTSASERADPEDVRARIRPYHARLRTEIERYGGTVEKFIGDAVMGVFGAPVTHEDDAERAVRAGLRISEAIEELNEETPELDLRFRIGINTGEAVVALGARPERGEGMVTGDVVNTASRLQTSAPLGAVVVGETTYEVTRTLFDYEALEPVVVKGKAQPVARWRARATRARLGTDLRPQAAPLVGRELELRLLQDTFERTVRNRSVQLVTIVGEPGVGKSRLVTEMLDFVDDWPDLVRWRQGRCLPYGDGITFWPLGEIMKAETGILASDSPATAAAKLEAALPEAAPDREWLRQRLAPLVGLGTPSVVEREESFTAWRKFLELIAERNPAVFVFEDLHWADEAMLAFVEHLADWSEGVPMLVLATARPELYEREAGWAGGKRNATTINLSPLGDRETAQLISVLLASAVIPADVQSLILERAGGNPLYAEEFVRLLRDRGYLLEGGITLAGKAGLPLPEGLQAIIAARLDTLSASRKAMLQDAAVLGKVFWAGALAAMGDLDSKGVWASMHELSRKELVRPARVSSMAGEVEYSFWHLLVRDVAYAQIPRAARIDKHRRAAAWIESRAGERVEDLAEILAYHYTSARELAVATGQTDVARELEAPALRFLTLAGDRALGLDATKAEANLALALELAPPGHLRHPELLARWAEAAAQLGRHSEAAAALEEAVTALLEQGESLAAAQAMTTLADVLWNRGDPRRREVLAEAVALLESRPATPDLVAAYAETARQQALSGEYTLALESAERTLTMARDLDLEEPAKLVGYRGFARCGLGDAAGLDDLRKALDLTIERGQAREAGRWFTNVSVFLFDLEGPAAGLAVLRQGIDFEERHRITEMAQFLRAESLTWLDALGSWDEVLKTGGDLDQRLEATGSLVSLFDSRLPQAHVLALRGRMDEALPLVEWMLGPTAKAVNYDRLARGLVVAALARLAVGEPERARELLGRLEHSPGGPDIPMLAAFFPTGIRVAIGAGDIELAERLASRFPAGYAYHDQAVLASRAALAEARGATGDAAGRYAEAAERWDRLGAIPERGFALLGQGRSLLDLGRSAAAEEPLRQAREIFSRLGAVPALAETDALLGKAAARTS